MKKNYWMLLFFVVAFYLLPIIFRPLMTPDEFRYAEIPREMIERADFITPKLLDVRYFEKTPMGYWFTAASFKIFGQNAFALRLIPVLGAVGGAFLLWWWCRRRKYASETALNAAFLYLAGGMTWLLGTFATLDSLFAMWTTATLVCFALIMESRDLKERLLLMVAAGIALGCGFLTKGFLAYALPGVSVAFYLLWQKRWKEFIILPWIPLAVSALVIAPWAIAIHKAEPDYWHYFVVYEHFQRFTDSASGQHAAPFWLLFPFLLVGLFPAAFPVLTGMARLKKNCFQELWNSPEARFALTSLVLPVLFLSISDGKLPTYVLPCFAPAAMLGALVLDKTDSDKCPPKMRQLTTVTSLIFIVIGSAALLGGLFYLPWGTGFVPTLSLQIAVWAPFLTTAALGMIISGTIFFIYRRSKLPEPGSYFMLYAVAMMICVWFLPGFTAYYKMPEYELLDIASQLSAEKIDRPRIMTYPKIVHAAAWCFKDSSIQLINSAGEMEYGHKSAIAHGERPLVLSYKELQEKISAPDRKEGILIILRKKDVERLNKYIPAGRQFTTAGELCAFYHPAKQQGGKKK